MNGSVSDAPGRESAGAPSRVTPEIAAEAALWVTRLHGPERDATLEREFQAWHARSPAHREAFGKCTETWLDVSGLKLSDAYGAVSASRRGRSAGGIRSAGWRWAGAGAFAVVVALGAMVFQRWQDEGDYRTAVGEQRWVVLDDGTRMLLNTDTRVRVAFDAAQRTVRVASGEALFEVAKEPRRPFVVRAAGSEVVAVGTAFSVRFTDGPKKDGGLAVTLIEGRVNVRPAAEQRGDTLAPSQPVELQAGDRLQLDRDARVGASIATATVDRPNVEQVMAWKRREAVFQEASLADAVAEMNRYNRTPVVLSRELQSTTLRVSGVFRAGDSAGFARAVAALHGLKVAEVDGRLELENFR